MPLYANTHTETSGTGLQTRFVNAREMIHKAVGERRRFGCFLWLGCNCGYQ